MLQEENVKEHACIALMIVPTNGMASWESDETMVGNNSQKKYMGSMYDT